MKTGFLIVLLFGMGLYGVLGDEIGEATRVGNAVDFGVDETFPIGLASIGDTLYIQGVDTHALYTVDTVTGKATWVRVAQLGVAQFGVNGKAIIPGQAAIGDTLYIIRSDALHTGADINRDHALYTVDTVTGKAKQVGDAFQFGVGEAYPFGLASIGETLYMVGGLHAALFTVDTTTGEATQIGFVDGFGVGEWLPAGLASIGDTLYMVGTGTKALYTLRYK